MLSTSEPVADAEAARADQARRRQQMLFLLRSIDQAWVRAFHESGFSDVHFSRLFTELWLRGDTAITKTDAYDLIRDVGVQTAIKYVRHAVEAGYLEEVDNPADRRSRLLRMTPRLKESFLAVLDGLDASVREILGSP